MRANFNPHSTKLPRGINVLVLVLAVVAVAALLLSSARGEIFSWASASASRSFQSILHLFHAEHRVVGNSKGAVGPIANHVSSPVSVSRASIQQKHTAASNASAPSLKTGVRQFADQTGRSALNIAAPVGIGSTTIGNSARGRVRAPDAILTARTWNNLGTDWNTAANWTGGAPTVANAVGKFITAESVQPNLSAPVSIAGIYFSGTGTSGYDITRTGGAVFTLNGTDPTGAGGTANGSAVPLRGENTSGTNTVDVPIILGAAGGTQVFYQEAGGRLIVNGVVSNTNTITLSLKGGGTIELNGANTFSGGSNTATNAGQTVVLGNDSALGTGTFTVGISSTIQAGGGARSIANAVILDGTTTIGGSDNIIFSGDITLGPSAVSRTLTVNNTGNTTLSGNVFLSGVAGTGRTLVVNGTGATTISGVISNFNGAGTAGNLSKSGNGALTLTGTNTYTGTTSVSAGALLINGNNSAATGAVSVTNTGTLGGTGMIGGAVTVNGAGNITGATNGTVGALTLNSGLTLIGTSGNLASYIVDLTSGSGDRLSITGNLDLSTMFDQILFQGTTGAASYQLATYTGALTGVFDTVTNLPTGYSLQYNTGEIDLVMAPVPEASTWVVGALAVAVIGWSVLKRRKAETLKS